ncbi:AfsR/SARP family transcriptional regulator [Asanoa ferruginea]|uniref:AfsR/SARP family transcriptional regulator n=1 Tax=Asanoa ferruginea TaxID=53367 RepID=UPI0014775286|nr:AfsR/SARP family transcriptional regulator [Asanoa ferruginea]
MTGDTRFLLLGPIEAHRGDQPLPLGRRRERCLLAVLLLAANRVVPAERLMDLLWDGDPPDSARASLHTHVSRLRVRLEPGVVIAAQHGGYVVRTDPAAIDAHRFAGLVRDARAVTDPERRATVLRRALALWRGPALADSGSDRLRERVVADLTELRLTALELAIDADLACGRHADVVVEASGLVAEHPLREGLWERFALALHRSDRRADALDVLDRARARLAHELGIDPGPGLARMRQAILTADPGLAPPPPRAGGLPRQLPMDIAEFTGREAEIESLVELAGRPSGAARIAVVEGMAGVGKTRLAVHVARLLVDQGRFDEVQLWADLHGLAGDQPRADPHEVLGRFLRELGVPDAPVDPQERAALYRSLLAGRRVLVLLDNAADEEQVRPLLPGGPHCLVLITTRRRLFRLEGGWPLPLDVFSPSEAAELITRVAGPGRVVAHTADVAQLAELCGHLPLAVTLAARRLQGRPTWTVADLVDRLATDDSRQTLQSAFDLSYQALGSEQRRFLRMLGLHPGPDFTADSLGALVARPRDEAEGILESLLDEHLVQQRVPGRYLLHDLVRGYAASRVARDESVPTRHAAIGQLLTHYLDLARQATLLIHPSESRRVARTSAGADGRGWPRTAAEAAAWGDANLPTLVATVRLAAGLPGPLPRLAVELVLALYRPLANRGHHDERLVLNALAAHTAGRIGDRRAEAQALEDLGVMCGQIGRLTEAVQHISAALAIWRELDDPIGITGCLTQLGNSYRQLGRFDDAVRHLRRSLAVSRAADYRAGAAGVLNNLGLALQGMGAHDRALRYQRRSVAAFQALDNHRGASIARANLGWACQRAGQPGEALGHHRAGLRVFREVGDRYNEAEQLWALGLAHHTLGEHGVARASWRDSVGQLVDLGHLADDEGEELLAAAVPATPDVIRLNS